MSAKKGMEGQHLFCDPPSQYCATRRSGLGKEQIFFTAA
ncbi:hypothetical protein APS_0813 [Acetobacter pasteurianus subsp. pasteurianus LMG 1262 = NBRC 106471]|nr:hypothetical protein APS_0813 [Acetobacter pasteurianus subsp. pasteurianus LMG 1262 = NBRC 106471]